MAAENIVSLLEAAAVSQGVTLLDDNKAALEAAAAKVAPEVIANVVNAVNSRLTDGGLTGLVESKIKNIDVAAEPEMDAAAANALDGLLDEIDTAGKNLVGQLTGGAS